MYAVQTMLNIFSNMLPDMRVVEWIRTLEPPNFPQNILHGDNEENLLKNQFSYWWTVRIDIARFQDKNKQSFKGKHFLSNSTNSIMKRNPPSASPPWFSSSF